MILTKEHQEACINAYVKAGHNKDECIGFIDGFEKAMSLVKNCNAPAVSKCDGIEREALLKAFYHYVDMNWTNGMLTDKVDEVIEGFKSL